MASSVQSHFDNFNVTIDLALTPLGTDGTLADGCDGSLFGMTVNAVPEPSSAALLLCAIPLILRRRRG